MMSLTFTSERTTRCMRARTHAWDSHLLSHPKDSFEHMRVLQGWGGIKNHWEQYQ